MAFDFGYFSQASSFGAKKDEIATLIVRGTYFSDWETVWIKDQWEDPNPEFRFTSAERENVPNLWSKLQFLPRDTVEIWLANVPMVTSTKSVSGVILVRQVAYDANNHGVSLQGVGVSWYAARASIVPSIDGLTFKGSLKDITEKLLAPTGVGLATIGDIPGKPFNPPVQANPGESRFSFIERLSRMRNVMIGSTSDGDWLLIGKHHPPISGDLIEGFNILSAQIVFSDVAARNMFYAGAQKTATDQSNMGDAAHQERPAQGSLGRFSPLYVPVEHPVKDLDEVQMRADHEQMWNEGEDINATIKVNGWFNPRTRNIWKAGQVYMVDSPMGPLHKPLGARSVTYTQDRQSGTQTTLDLVQPWRLKMIGYGQAPEAQSDAMVDPSIIKQSEISDVTITPS
jgi:prophage tail gpP-like protein